ncbi:MAG: hypothetical protein ABGY41_03780, partial [Candidatus Poribacteria bacterium]
MPGAVLGIRDRSVFTLLIAVSPPCAIEIPSRGSPANPFDPLRPASSMPCTTMPLDAWTLWMWNSLGDMCQ